MTVSGNVGVDMMIVDCRLSGGGGVCDIRGLKKKERSLRVTSQGGEKVLIFIFRDANDFFFLHITCPLTRYVILSHSPGSLHSYI